MPQNNCVLAMEILQLHRKSVLVETGTGIQHFELKDWMHIPIFLKTSFTTASMMDNQ